MERQGDLFLENMQSLQQNVRTLTQTKAQSLFDDRTNNESRCAL